jgi:hypothetical protein
MLSSAALEWYSRGAPVPARIALLALALFLNQGD